MLKILLILTGSVMAGIASLGMAFTGTSDEPQESARGEISAPIFAAATASPSPTPTPTATPTVAPTARPTTAPAAARSAATPKPKPPEPKPEPKVTAPSFPTPKPTPKPTPTPTSSPDATTSESREQVKAAIRAEWQGDDEKAIAVADCESSLNTRASSPNGINLGLWQMRQQTWEEHGGTGDPRDHSAAQQTRIAWKVFQARGWDAWPGCA